ncbi:sporulation protein YqfD [Sporolactobacillus spathodeae]|uniref:Sporulation protein YqfD n=1 Tax=Sporolactobacillus spathodeae TaxID=1465502 RepID=A0ABS2Q6Y5_9BACL|nr:hypothetical protein [Sporolactobacillus spathodeae]
MEKRISPIGGSIKAEVSGRAPEAFLRECVQQGIPLWSIQRKNETTIICSMKQPDPEWLREALTRSGCRIRILEKKGLPFFVKRVQGRMGIVIGLLFFLGILLVLSNMVWSVQVKGADPRLEAQIRTLLSKQHLYPGSLDFFVPNTKQIETQLSAKLSKVTWIGVSRDGTTYRVDVVQKKYPRKGKGAGPRNIVATKQAIIQKLYVEKGQPVVESNQFVKPGQLLVLGRIGDEKSYRFVAAQGQVIGETWYETQVQIPLSGRYTLYTGKSKTQYRLKFWNFPMPIWGFSNHPFPNADKETENRAIRFLFWKMPIDWQTITFREKKQITRRLSLQEALDEAGEAADQKLLGQLGPNAEIVSTVIDKKTVRHRVLFISSHQVVYENIGRYQNFDSRSEKAKLKKKVENQRN